MRQFWTNFLLLIASLLILLVVLEGVTRIYLSCSLNYDFEMWRYASELKEPLSDPLLPFQHKPNCSGNYYGVEIKTNSIGLRGGEPLLPKPAGVKRVLLLGDSFTLGWGVPAAETFASKLEFRLNSVAAGYEVINMGTGNYNSSMEVELFKRKGLALKPDIVVLMYYINDTEPLPLAGGVSYPVLKHFYLPSYISARLRQFSLMSKDKDWLKAYYEKIYDPEAAAYKKGREAIQELIRIAAQNHIKLLIVNIPDLHQLNPYPFWFATAFPRDIAKEHSVPFLDLHPFFSRFSGRELWVSEDDSHLNSAGNGIASGAIFEKLLSEGMVSRQN